MNTTTKRKKLGEVWQTSMGVQCMRKGSGTTEPAACTVQEAAAFHFGPGVTLRQKTDRVWDVLG